MRAVVFVGLWLLGFITVVTAIEPPPPPFEMCVGKHVYLVKNNEMTRSAKACTGKTWFT